MMQCLLDAGSYSEEEFTTIISKWQLIVIIMKWKDLIGILLSSLDTAPLLPSLQSQSPSSLLFNLLKIVKPPSQWIYMSVFLDSKTHLMKKYYHCQQQGEKETPTYLLEWKKFACHQTSTTSALKIRKQELQKRSNWSNNEIGCREKKDDVAGRKWGAD